MTYEPTYPVLVVTPDLDLQTVFDAIVNHLERQGSRCLTKGKFGAGQICANRNGAGQACAAACLMTDEEAHLNVSFAKARANNNLPKRFERHGDMIADMQRAHDAANLPGMMNLYIAEVANRYGLTFKLLSWGGEL